MNTLIYQSLLRFLESLNIPIVACLRDSQNYIRAAETGLGIHEMKEHQVGDDTRAWEPLTAWLENTAHPAALRAARHQARDHRRDRLKRYLRFASGSGSCSQDPFT